MFDLDQIYQTLVNQTYHVRIYNMVKIREMKHQTEVIRWLKEKINGKNESAQGQRKYDRQGLISKNLDFK